MVAVEIKSGETYRNEFVKNLKFWSELTQTDKKNLYLIYGGSESLIYNEINVMKWNDTPHILL